MGAIGEYALGATVLQHFGSLDQGACGIDHVVHDHAVAAVDLADHMHHFRHIGSRTAFVDDGQIAAELFGQRASTHDTTDIGAHHHQVRVVACLQVRQQHRRSVDVVDRNIEKSLDLVSMQVHRQQAFDADGLQQIGHHPGADRHPGRARAAVLAGIAEIGNHCGDAANAGAFQGIDHDQQFHQVFVGRRAGGLDHENITGADVLLDLDGYFTIGKATDYGFAELDAQMRNDFLRQRRIGVTCEEDGIQQHKPSFKLRTSGQLSCFQTLPRGTASGLAPRGTENLGAAR